jgi:predicted RNA binding protein YcfA (HicA-like mRNA interferase family)
MKVRTVTVSGKSSKDIPPGTLNSILKQAGLKGDVEDDEP